MAIKPFKATNLQTSERGLAGKRWVMTQIRRALAKLNISAEGLDISETGDGNIHLSAPASSSLESYFLVSTNSIKGGPVLVNVAATGLEYHHAVIPDAQHTPSSGQFVCLQTYYSRDTGAPDFSRWGFVNLAQPSANFARKWGSQPGSDGPVSIPLAYYDGTKLWQHFRGALHIRVWGDAATYTRML